MTNTKHVCSGCIGEPFLAREVKRQGTRHVCTYCGKRRNSVALEDLADRIHDALQEQL